MDRQLFSTNIGAVLERTPRKFVASRGLELLLSCRLTRCDEVFMISPRTCGNELLEGPDGIAAIPFNAHDYDAGIGQDDRGCLPELRERRTARRTFSLRRCDAASRDRPSQTRSVRGKPS